MLWFLLANETSSTTWEQRVGSFHAQCQRCGQAAWQHTFRIYRTKGSGFSGPGPYDAPQAECFQVRCAACASASMVAHPSYWGHSVAFVAEQYPPSMGHPGYVAIAYPAT